MATTKKKTTYLISLSQAEVSELTNLLYTKADSTLLHKLYKVLHTIRGA